MAVNGIYEPNDKFPFDKLNLTAPTVLSGGNYFIKYLVQGAPLYIQPPKCKTRGGITKSGKRNYCDLVFTNENEDFIRWMEDIESHSCRSIYSHREKWFETEMDLPEIENYFAAPLKSYKSGKFYLARTNIPTRLGKMTLKIYDESEQDVDPETIGENTEIITILEVQGIKCSARSFQIEMEVKQMMVLRPTNLFERCILGKGRTDPPVSEPTHSQVHAGTETLEPVNDQDHILDNKQIKATEEPLVETVQSNDQTNFSQFLESTEYRDPTVLTETMSVNLSRDPSNDPSVDLSRDPSNDLSRDPSADLSSDLSSDPSNESGSSTLDDLEVDLHVDTLPEDETFQIKARNEVYYAMYREARQKAKIARTMALAAYLEAKQIKSTYNLDDIDESDDDGNEDQELSAEQ